MLLVRTTIDMPEDLLRRAKAEAALRGQRLKDFVSEAVRRSLADAGRQPERNRDDIIEQELGPGYVLPLITGDTGPDMARLTGGQAQRLLDEDDIDRAIHSR